MSWGWALRRRSSPFANGSSAIRLCASSSIPRAEWSDELIADLVDTGAVDSLDLKSFYRDTPVDQPADPDLYRRLVDAFPDAWLEDAGINDETRPILEPVRDRLTWDAPIHSIADIEALPYPPKMVNVKPSRFGPLRALFDAYDYLDERGIQAYGGGHGELAQGRGHNQYLAALFIRQPNDVRRWIRDHSVPEGLPPARSSPARRICFRGSLTEPISGMDRPMREGLERKRPSGGFRRPRLRSHFS